MKKILLPLVVLASFSFVANAQLGKKLNVKKAVSAASKGVQSFTISDKQLKQYADEATVWEDANNQLCKTTGPASNMTDYAERLEKIAANVPADLVAKYNIDIKAYHVTGVNAYARPNGAIRVYTPLLDLMTDDEVLAVIGHEIGHIVNEDSKDAFATALRASALKDAVGAVGGDAASALSDSQLGGLAEALANSTYSQKQEFEADRYGYEFMAKIKKDPASMASALGVILNLQKEAGSQENSKFDKLFSTHPDLDKRIDKLNSK